MIQELETVVVSRHPRLVDYLKQEGWVSPDTPFIEANARPDDVQGKHVFGVLPMWLAAKAVLVTEVFVNPPWDWRGAGKQDLTIEEIRLYVRAPVTYEINEVHVAPRKAKQEATHGY